MILAPFASATDVVEVEDVGNIGLFICFPLFGGRLCHLGSEKFSSRSDEPCQLIEVSVRPRGLFVFSSHGMNPPEKSFVSFLLIVFCLNMIALIEVLQLLKILNEREREFTDCEQNLTKTEFCYWVAIDRFRNVWNV